MSIFYLPGSLYPEAIFLAVSAILLRSTSSKIVKSETAPLPTAVIAAAAHCSKGPSISAIKSYLPLSPSILNKTLSRYTLRVAKEDAKISYIGDWTSYNYRKAMQDAGYKNGDPLGGEMFPTLYETN